MPAAEFFTGTTQAGRTLVLYYEHTSYEAFTDHAGEVVHEPTETNYTATLDGAPVELAGPCEICVGESVTVVTDLGTFTAIATDSAADHSDALRRYLEHRPSGGWEVSVADKRKDGDEWSYTFTITNGRVSERAEFRLSEQVMRTLARGAGVPTDEQVIRQIAQKIRSDTWETVKKRAESPTTLVWIAHAA